MEMKSKSLIKSWKNLELNEIIINESFITGIIWLGPETLKVELDWVGQEDIYKALKLKERAYKTCFLFENVWLFNINLQYDNSQIGEPEITDFSFLECEDNTKDVKFDFFHQPQGYIKFKCNNINFLIEGI